MEARILDLRAREPHDRVLSDMMCQLDGTVHELTLDENDIDDDTLTSDTTFVSFARINFCTLTNLVALSLRHNRIATIPHPFFLLSSLQALDVSHNDISIIDPAIIRAFPQLSLLMLSYNRILFIPPDIGLLAELRELWLDHNELSCIPSQIGTLSQLEHLYVHSNQINYLTPGCFAELTKLHTLYIHTNQITEIPTDFVHLCSLQQFLLFKNPIIYPPQEVCYESIQSLMQYFILFPEKPPSFTPPPSPTLGSRSNVPSRLRLAHRSGAPRSRTPSPSPLSSPRPKLASRPSSAIIKTSSPSYTSPTSSPSRPSPSAFRPASFGTLRSRSASPSPLSSRSASPSPSPLSSRSASPSPLSSPRSSVSLLAHLRGSPRSPDVINQAEAVGDELSLVDLLKGKRNPAETILFRKFLEEKYCVETFYFWQAVDAFHTQVLNLPGGHLSSTSSEIASVRQALEDITTSFLLPDSQYEVNISFALRMKIDEAVYGIQTQTTYDTDVVDKLVDLSRLLIAAQSEIYDLIESNFMGYYAK
eukprot:TRINITY_DN4087_c0_g1_i5.p1 TRINITY_DN4087_c0_g1~~TRINITY_DN4087_c0_g1_i5.p1  ORF type:complete len:533 (+),score=113.24 TRINITY_DN4087_c0_g1_i5:851-2449(+)